MRKLSALDHASVPNGDACSQDRLGPEVVLHLSSERSQLIPLLSTGREVIATYPLNNGYNHTF